MAKILSAFKKDSSIHKIISWWQVYACQRHARAIFLSNIFDVYIYMLAFESCAARNRKKLCGLCTKFYLIILAWSQKIHNISWKLCLVLTTPHMLVESSLFCKSLSASSANLILRSQLGISLKHELSRGIKLVNHMYRQLQCPHCNCRHMWLMVEKRCWQC